MNAFRPSRRDLLAGGLAVSSIGFPRMSFGADGVVTLRLRRESPTAEISQLVFGSNEIGVMDGGAASATFDAQAGVTARRFGGDLTTTYNWVNNACNAGKNHNQANGDFLLDALKIPKEEWQRPGVVVEAMHEASLRLGARSLVTLPLSPYVAADMDGAVPAEQTAPSRRFVPTRWTVGAGARDPIDRGVCDLPQFVARLIDKYGAANNSRGVFAYALDNEPGLWTQNHPRVFPSRMAIDDFIARSIAAARAIKTVDPSALVFGPASWGATELVNFQNAPDWPAHAHHGNFLALYLDAFRKASEQDGRRLLDVLDVHWYPFTNSGQLFRTDTEALDAVRLDAPRSLTEPGFVENSWVPRALSQSGEEAIGLPLLPSLQRLVARRYPGTKLAIGEFNYGLGKRMPSALALADALGRYATSGVFMATHWGSLADLLTQSYWLYRAPDIKGAGFAGRIVALEYGAPEAISVFAAESDGALRLVLINRAQREFAIDIPPDLLQSRPLLQTLGFDDSHPDVGECPDRARDAGGALRLAVPPLSARRYLFA